MTGAFIVVMLLLAAGILCVRQQWWKEAAVCGALAAPFIVYVLQRVAEVPS